MHEIFDLATINKSSSRRFADREPDGAARCPLAQRLALGIFFDGTDNNKERDTKSLEHTNVARMFELYETEETGDDPQADWRRIKHYEIGIGGRTSEDDHAHGEHIEEDPRNEFACDPSADDVTNALDAAPRAAKARSAHIVKAVALLMRNLREKATGAGGKARLQSAYAVAAARVSEIATDQEKVIDIFGFSRGAALARTLTNLVVQALALEHANVRVRFLGLFDTVASFKFGAGRPQNLHVPEQAADHILHITAKNESRKNFPLSVTSGEVLECTGAHSDIGGGYAPGTDGRLNHIAAVTLSWMYQRTATAGVCLRPIEPEISNFGMSLSMLSELENEMNALNVPAGGGIFEEDRFIVVYGAHNHSSMVAETTTVERPSYSLLNPEQRAFIAKYVHRSHSTYSLILAPTADMRRVCETWAPRSLDKPPPQFSWSGPYRSTKR